MDKRDFNVVGNEGTDNQEIARALLRVNLRGAFFVLGKSHPSGQLL